MSGIAEGIQNTVILDPFRREFFVNTVSWKLKNITCKKHCAEFKISKKCFVDLMLQPSSGVEIAPPALVSSLSDGQTVNGVGGQQRSPTAGDLARSSSFK